MRPTTSWPDPDAGLSFLDTRARRCEYGRRLHDKYNSRRRHPQAPSAACAQQLQLGGLKFGVLDNVFSARWIKSSAVPGTFTILEEWNVSDPANKAAIQSLLASAGLSAAQIANETTLWESSASLHQSDGTFDFAYRGYFWRRDLAHLSQVTGVSTDYLWVDANSGNGPRNFMTVQQVPPAQLQRRPNEHTSEPARAVAEAMTIQQPHAKARPTCRSTCTAHSRHGMGHQASYENLLNAGTESGGLQLAATTLARGGDLDQPTRSGGVDQVAQIVLGGSRGTMRHRAGTPVAHHNTFVPALGHSLQYVEIFDGNCLEVANATAPFVRHERIVLHTGSRFPAPLMRGRNVRAVATELGHEGASSPSHLSTRRRPQAQRGEGEARERSWRTRLGGTTSELVANLASRASGRPPRNSPALVSVGNVGWTGSRRGARAYCCLGAIASRWRSCQWFVMMT